MTTTKVDVYVYISNMSELRPIREQYRQKHTQASNRIITASEFTLFRDYRKNEKMLV